MENIDKDSFLAQKPLGGKIARAALSEVAGALMAQGSPLTSLIDPNDVDDYTAPVGISVDMTGIVPPCDERQELIVEISVWINKERCARSMVFMSQPAKSCTMRMAIINNESSEKIDGLSDSEQDFLIFFAYRTYLVY